MLHVEYDIRLHGNVTGAKVTVASVKLLLGVEWSDTPLVNLFGNKGLLLDSDSPIIVCLSNFVGTHSWNRQLGDNAGSLDSNQITLCIVMGSSFGVLSSVVFVDLILFANPNLFPINCCFNWHKNVSAKDQLS